MMDEDWAVLTSFFPKNWRELALSTNALKGLRKDKSAENLLRTLLIHLGCGYSLRETVVRAQQADLADMSDVALLKRLRKSRDWLCALCVALFAERGVRVQEGGGLQMRLFDATNVTEPGKTGSLWRIHYSVRVPSLRCDFFKLTETEGEGSGESLTQFPIGAGDYVVADRGYCTASGIHYVAAQQGCLAVRVNPQSLPMVDGKERRFPLLAHLRNVRTAGVVRWWPVWIPLAERGAVAGRLCVIRKTAEAIRQTQQRLRLRASRKGQELKPETLVYGEYVIVFTTFPEADFDASAVLEWYRLRWQIELVFKRFKQIAQLGHLPKYDDESAQAWLYGKLLVALLTEKLIDHAVSVSPWGYLLAETPAA